MRKEIFLSAFLILYLLQEDRAFLQKQVPLGDLNLAKFIELTQGNGCLQVAFNENNQVNGMFKLHEVNSILLKIISYGTLKRRDIRFEVLHDCENYLIFANTSDDLKNVFDLDRDNGKQFFPFTKIYLYISENLKGATNFDSQSQLQNFLFRNALFGYIFELKKNRNGLQIRDLLTNDLKRSISSYTPSDLFHPMVDTRIVKDDFRISLFNCKPFTFYPEDASDDTIINEMDGTEIRFVKEVTKNWKKSYNFRDFSRTKLSPYITIMNDLANQSSDLAMCSIWLMEKYYERYDLTTFYGQLCSTLLVPKPRKLNEASAVYTTLSTFVWILFLCFFLLSTILLNSISRMEKSLYRRESQYIDFTRALMETINTVTSHAVYRFPSGQKSLQILLSSWILFSMWMDISYTTIYTARLTSPSYEEPVNTVKQFLEHGLYICTPYVKVDFVEEFRTSVNEDYQKLSSRSKIYGENLSYRRQLIANRKCGMLAHRSPMKNYFALRLKTDDDDLLETFRIMEDCLSTHYFGFAFQKHSPYTKLFNWHIRRYQENGMIQKWYGSILSNEQGRYKAMFIDHPERDAQHKINLVNVSGAFYLLGTGLLVSAMSFFLEMLKYKRTLS